MASSQPSTGTRAAESAAGIAVRAPGSEASQIGNRSPRLQLEAVHRSTPLAPVSLPVGRYTLGSDPQCEICIPVEGVAARHCLLVVGEERAIVKAWTPQTWINDGLVNEATLRVGDRLILGPVELRVAAALPSTPLPEAVLRETVRELQRPAQPQAPVISIPPELRHREELVQDLLEQVQQALDDVLRRERDSAQVHLRERMVLEHRARELDRQREELRNRELQQTNLTAAPVAVPAIDPAAIIAAESQSLKLRDWETQLQARYDELAGRAAELSQKNRAIRWRMEELSQFDSRRAVAEQAEQQVRSLQARYSAQQRQLETQTQALAEQVESLQGQSAEVHRDRKLLLQERRKLEEERKGWENQRRSRESLLNDLEESLAGRTRDVDREAERLAEWEERLAGERRDINQVRFAHDVEEVNLRQSQEALSEKRQNAEGEILAQREELDALRAELEEARRRWETDHADDAQQSSRLEGMADELAVREQVLAQREAASQELSAELADRQSQLNELKSQLESREREFQSQQAAFHSEVEKLQAQRSADNARAEEFSRRQTELESREEQLQQLSRDLEQQLAEFEQRQADLAAEHSALDAERTQLQRTEEAQAARAAELEAAGHELEAQRAELKQLQEQFRTAADQPQPTIAASPGDLEVGLKSLREMLAARDSELSVARAQLAAQPSECLLDGPASLASDLEQREAALAQKELEIREHDACLEEREQELRRQLNALDEKTDGLTIRSSEMDDREGRLAILEADIASRETELAQSEAAIEEQRQALLREKEELQQRAIEKTADQPAAGDAPAAQSGDAARQERLELARLRARLDVEKIEQAREAARLQELKQKLDRESRQLDGERLALVDERDNLAADRADLQQQTEELERRRAELETEFQKREEQLQPETPQRQPSGPAQSESSSDAAPDTDYDAWRASVLARFGLEAPAGSSAAAGSEAATSPETGAADNGSAENSTERGERKAEEETRARHVPAPGGLRSELAEMFGLGQSSQPVANSDDTLTEGDPETQEALTIHPPSQDRLDRMLGGVSRSAPAAAAPEPPAAVAPTRRDLNFAEDADVESSVASYMEGLLARSRPGGPSYPSSTPEPRPAAPVPPPPPPVRSVESQAQQVADEAAKKARKLKQEDKESLRANIDSFRELANHSARSAVAKSQVNKKQTNLKGIASGAVLAWVTTGLLLSTELWMTIPQRIPAVAAGLVAMVLSVFAYLRYGEIRLLRGSSQDGPARESASAAEPESPANASDDEQPNSNPLSFL